MASTLLIDTNLLLLLLVGAVAPHLIGTHRRLSQFDTADFERVAGLSEDHASHVTLPNILSEVSNFIGSGRQQIAPDASEALAQYTRFVDEVYQPSLSVVDTPLYPRLGLTDSAIFMLSSKPVTVVTVDHQLYGILAHNGVTAINLMHQKTPGYHE